MDANKTTYNLEERTTRFAESILKFCKKIPENIRTRPLITQIVRAGTSIGANYHEANDAETKKDFVHKLGICRKESKETMYWLRLITTEANNFEIEINNLYQEANEFNRIFSAAIRTSRNKMQ